MLAVTDPAIVGAVADGIVVVVHASTLRHHDAARTRELLDNLGTPVLGMIVNGIGHADSGYGMVMATVMATAMATTAPVVRKGRTGRSLILFLCWPRPNRNPIQTAMAKQSRCEDEAVFLDLLIHAGILKSHDPAVRRVSGPILTLGPKYL